MVLTATSTTMASELMKGRDSAARLASLLLKTSRPPADVVQELVAEILGGFDRALSALLFSKKVEASSDADANKKRKISNCNQRETEQHDLQKMVVTKNTIDDEHSWRKYGQKHIRNCKFPRCYFRCTYRYDQNCEAMKQVQQSEEDPSMYVITYMGEHKCTELAILNTIGDIDSTQSLYINFSSTPTSCSRSSLSSASANWPTRSCSDAEVPRSSYLPLLESSITPSNLKGSTTLVELISNESDHSDMSPDVQSPVDRFLDWDFGENSFDMDSMTDYDPFGLFQV